MTRTFGLRRQTSLTEDQVALIACAVERVVEAGGWGSVEIVLERGRIEAVRTTTSQLFIEQALASSSSRSHGRGRDDREGR